MSDNLEILPVEIHLPGLLKLLGEHLYSDPRVAIREMAQNAHDSCMRRRSEDSSVTDAYEPEVRLRIDHASQQLLIEDNGSGLTRDEVITFLATVGRGYTGELRQRLGDAGRDEALDLIGMFGLGLLSAFMIAQQLDITTKSYQTPESAWRWVSDGGQSYALRSSSRESVGTTVRLDLRDEAKYLMEPGILADILRVYAEFLPVPIYIENDSDPINGHPAPWMQAHDKGPARAALYSTWVEERRQLTALSVLPLEDIQTDDGRIIPLHGVLYIPPRSIISLQEYGEVTVYVRHMLITERERDLLPDWARFVSGVIDCPLLNPTASRETLRHDEIYEAVRAGIARQLLGHCEYLAQQQPHVWHEIIHAHNDLIKGWASRSTELFNRVADLVTFTTSRGILTLPEYLHENPGRIFYFDDPDGSTQVLALFEARRLAVIDARWFADEAFIKRYGAQFGVPVEELQPGAGYIFTPVEDPSGEWKAMLDACRASGTPARLMAFEPEHLPVILLFPPGAERARRAERTLREGSLNSPIRRLVRGYLDRQAPDEETLKGVLHLNARNPLLRRLRELGPTNPQFAPVLRVLIANARVFAGQGISAQDAIACFEQVNDALAELAGVQTHSQGRGLTSRMLTDLGLSRDAAERLCAACETIEALISADIQTLAERTRISPLMVATVQQELREQATPPPMRKPEAAPPAGSVITFRKSRVNEPTSDQEGTEQ